ncbi:hypothetical protein H1R20_g15809, partial [Candolleomyces eurysporus]
MFNSPVSSLTSLPDTHSEARSSSAGGQSSAPSMMVTPVITRAQLNHPRRGVSYSFQYWQENFGVDAVIGWRTSVQPGDPDHPPSLVQTREQSPESELARVSPMLVQSTPPTSHVGSPEPVAFDQSPEPVALERSPPPPYQQWANSHRSRSATPQLNQMTAPEPVPRSLSPSGAEQSAPPTNLLPARSEPALSTPELASQGPPLSPHGALASDPLKSLLLAPTPIPESSLPAREHTPQARPLVAIQTPELTTAPPTMPGPSLNENTPKTLDPLQLNGNSSAKSSLIGGLLPPVIFQSPIITFPVTFPTPNREINRLSPSAISRRLSSLALSEDVIEIEDSPSVINITSSPSVIEIESSPSIIVMDGLPSIIVIDNSPSQPSSPSMDLDELES